MTEIMTVYKLDDGQPLVDENGYCQVMPNPFVKLHGERNAVEFQIQSGPIKEVGQNGCQIDRVIEFAKRFIEYHNDKFPCTENEYVIQCLQQSLDGLSQRKLNREARGVEGTNQA